MHVGNTNELISDDPLLKNTDLLSYTDLSGIQVDRKLYSEFGYAAILQYVAAT